MRSSIIISFLAMTLTSTALAAPFPVETGLSRHDTSTSGTLEARRFGQGRRERARKAREAAAAASASDTAAAAAVTAAPADLSGNDPNAGILAQESADDAAAQSQVKAAEAANAAVAATAVGEAASAASVKAEEARLAAITVSVGGAVSIARKW